MTDPRLTMTERELQQTVIDMAKLHRWMGYHTFDSRRSNPGFPDLILVRDDRMLALELKTAKGKVTVPQIIWLEAFAKIPGCQAHLLRPADLISGEITRILR